jgi:hypothetical protein
MFPDLSGIVGDDCHCREFTPQYRDQGRLALERDDALGRAASADESVRKTPGSGAEFENRTGTREIDAARDRVGETSAAGIGGGEPQRFLHPKAKEDTRIRAHAVILLIGSQRDSIDSVLQFCVHQILRMLSQNGHLSVVSISRQTKGARLMAEKFD